MTEIRKEIKTLKKKIISLVIIAFLVAMIFPIAMIFPGVKVGMAANTGQVNCTVTAKLVSIEVLDGTISYGTVALSGEANSTTGSQTQIANNIGTVNVDFDIRTSNAVGGTVNWLVATVPAANAFNHRASINAGAAWNIVMNVEATYVTLKDPVANNTSQNFELQINMPTQTTDYTSHTITVTVLGTESSS